MIETHSTIAGKCLGVVLGSLLHLPKKTSCVGHETSVELIRTSLLNQGVCDQCIIDYLEHSYLHSEAASYIVVYAIRTVCHKIISSAGLLGLSLPHPAWKAC